MSEALDDYTHITFKSGHSIYAFGRMIGLSLDENRVAYGWDGYLPEVGDEFSVEDQRELAQMMIIRWQEYLESLGEEKL